MWPIKIGGGRRWLTGPMRKGCTFSSTAFERALRRRRRFLAESDEMRDRACKGLPTGRPRSALSGKATLSDLHGEGPSASKDFGGKYFYRMLVLPCCGLVPQTDWACVLVEVQCIARVPAFPSPDQGAFRHQIGKVAGCRRP